MINFARVFGKLSLFGHIKDYYYDICAACCSSRASSASSATFAISICSTLEISSVHRVSSAVSCRPSLSWTLSETIKETNNNLPGCSCAHGLRPQTVVSASLGPLLSPWPSIRASGSVSSTHYCHKFVAAPDCSVWEYVRPRSVQTNTAYRIRWCCNCASAFSRAACHSSSVPGTDEGPGSAYRSVSSAGKGLSAAARSNSALSIGRSYILIRSSHLNS